MFKPSCKNIFTDRSKAVLLLWIIFVIYVLCLSCLLVFSLQHCGHLLGEGCPICSLACDVLLCFVTFPCDVLGRLWYLIVSILDLAFLHTLTIINDFPIDLIYRTRLRRRVHTLHTNHDQMLLQYLDGLTKIEQTWAVILLLDSVARLCC